MWSVAAGFFFFAAFEIKPLYFTVVPAVLFLCAYVVFTESRETGKPMKILLLKTLPASALCISLLTLLLNLHMSNGVPYYRELLGRLPLQMTSDALAVTQERSVWAVESFFAVFANAAQYIYSSHDKTMAQGGVRLASLVMTGAWWLLLGALDIWWWRILRKQRNLLPTRQPPSFASICIILGAVTFILCSLLPRTSGPHHFIYPHVFFAGALTWYLHRLSLARPRIYTLIPLVLAVQMLAHTALTASRPGNVWRDPSRFEIVRLLQDDALASRSIVVYLDWGLYEIGTLYGSRQQIAIETYFGMDPVVKHVQKVARETGRAEILFIGHAKSSRLEPVRRAFRTLERVYPPPGVEKGWEVWKAVMPPADKSVTGAKQSAPP